MEDFPHRVLLSTFKLSDLRDISLELGCGDFPPVYNIDRSLLTSFLDIARVAQIYLSIGTHFRDTKRGT